MDKQRYVRLPLAGKIQHGIKNEKGIPKELGYFIAKTPDENMNLLVEKFNKIYGDKPIKLKIRFFSEEPFSVRKARYNQGGLACYCMQAEEKAKEKVKNLWKEKECSDTCEYAVSKDNKAPLCIEEGTLKFLIPEVTRDRVWYLKVTGITVIHKILNYIKAQKVLENSMIGDFYLYLTKEKHIRQSDGKMFNNYTLDILKIEDEFVEVQETLNQEKNVTEREQNIKNTPSNNKQTNKKESEDLAKEEKNVSNKQIKENKISQVTKKQTQKTNKIERKPNDIDVDKTSKIETAKEGEYDFNSCYYYMSLEPTIVDVAGKKKEYTLANFRDMDDKEISAIVRNEVADELKECDIGTVMILEIEEKINRNWITNCKYVQKCIKEIAA